MHNQEWWNRTFPRINALLLLLVIFPVFIIPALPPQFSSYLYPPFFTAIFLCAAFAIRGLRKKVFYVALLLTILFWIAHLVNNIILELTLRTLQICFFALMVFMLVKSVSSVKTVTKTVIADAITAYLMLGFAFSLLVTLVATITPDAYNFSHEGIYTTAQYDSIRNNIYYTFITYTTTGYGDILPLSPIAKSLAIFIGITGQLYIAIIMALLVGKFTASKN
jgi:voltage-gated potassium channel